MPYLIASTPRAGRWNHRLIVAESEQYDGLNLQQLVSMAREPLEGPAWLAVSQSVKQFSSERMGEELLILGDVDIASLSPSQKKEIKRQLQQYLEIDLNTLIKNEVDWDQEGKVDPVKRPELSRWLENFNSFGLSESKNVDWNLGLARKKREEQDRHTRKKVKHNKIKRFFMEPAGIAVSLATFIVLAGTVCYKAGCLKFEENTKLVSLDDKVCEHWEGQYDCSFTEEELNYFCELLGLKDISCKDELENSVEPEALLMLGEAYKDNPTGDSGLVPLPSLFAASKDHVRKEIKLGNETPLIPTRQFKDFIDYASSLKHAWGKLKFSGFVKVKPKGNGVEGSWSSDDYDDAVSEIKNFLIVELPKIVEENDELNTYYRFFKDDDFEKCIKR